MNSYMHKLDNLEEMNKFLETHYLPRLNQKETDHMNRWIISGEIEFVRKKFPVNKSPGPDNFTGEF